MNIHIHLSDPTAEALKALCEAIKESGLASMASVAAPTFKAPSTVGKGPAETEFNEKRGILRRITEEANANIPSEVCAQRRLEIMAANPHLDNLDNAAFKTEIAHMIRKAYFSDGAGDESIAIGASEPPPEDDGEEVI